MEWKSNNMGVIGKSPLFFINALQNILANGKENFELEFSVYVSGGQGITISREILRLQLDESLISKLDVLISKLLPGQELAFHSNLYVNSECYAIPLIDFTFNNWLVKKSVLNNLKQLYDEPLLIYSSGRSYHGYFLKKIPKSEWHRFLGTLLLLNPPNHNDENIDSRWVGHSLENDFSALRLSFNSEYYLKSPIYVGTV